MPYLNNNQATEEQKTVYKQFRDHLKHFHSEVMNRKAPLRGITHKYELWAVITPTADAPCVSVNLSAVRPHMTRADMDEFVEWLDTNTDFEHPIRVKGSTIKVLFRGDLAEDYGNTDEAPASQVTVEDAVGEMPTPPPTLKREHPLTLLR